MTAPASSPWLVAVEGVTRTKPVIRASAQRRGNRRARNRHEAVEWQAGQTLGVYYGVLAVASSRNPVVVAPFGADELHRPERRGTGVLTEHYPPELCGIQPRPAHWLPNDTTTLGRTRGQHERAAWAVAMRAATAAAGLPWNPRALLTLTDLPPTIGIDPGAEWTGMVACIGPQVLEAATIGRPAAPDHLSGFDIDTWLIDRLVAALAHLLTAHRPAAEAAWRRLPATNGGQEGTPTAPTEQSEVGEVARALPQSGSLALGASAYHPASSARMCGEADAAPADHGRTP